MKVWAILARVLAAIALIAYPAFVWIGLSSGSPRQVAMVLLAVMIPAMLFRASKSQAPKNVRGLAAVPATILVILITAALLDGSEFAMTYWYLVFGLPILLVIVHFILMGRSRPYRRATHAKEADYGRLISCIRL